MLVYVLILTMKCSGGVVKTDTARFYEETQLIQEIESIAQDNRVHLQGEQDCWVSEAEWKVEEVK